MMVNVERFIMELLDIWFKIPLENTEAEASENNKMCVLLVSFFVERRNSRLVLLTMCNSSYLWFVNYLVTVNNPSTRRA